MNAIRSLLAATDLSSPARHAAARAARLAKACGAELTLMHVIDQGALHELRSLLGAEAGPVEQRLVDQAREQLRALGCELGAPWGLDPALHLACGAVLPQVAGHADALDAGLLVLGARGESFMRHLLLGSTAERLLCRTLRPMLVVKQTPLDDYRRILLPVDFSPWSRGAISLARAIAPRADLVLLHAFDVPFEGKLRVAGVAEEQINHYRLAAREAGLRQLRQLAAELGLPSGATHFSVLQGDASRLIIEQEQEQDCDLIVLGKHGRSPLEELLLGSVTKHVLAESNGDVVVSALAAHAGP